METFLSTPGARIAWRTGERGDVLRGKWPGFGLKLDETGFSSGCFFFFAQLRLSIESINSKLQ